AQGSRSADEKRALAIGLTRADAGSGWIEASARSPYLVDLGATMTGATSAGMSGCFGQHSLGEVKTGVERSVSASAMSTLQQPSTAAALISLVIVMKPGSSITPGEWRAQFTDSSVESCVVAAVRKLFSQGGMSVAVARPSARRFATGSPLSGAF